MSRGWEILANIGVVLLMLLVIAVIVFLTYAKWSHIFGVGP